ncbi:MAG TPA: nucleotidyltransferase family protein [Polyangiaceae bacterium]|jgi:hypothetical protein|nr:nucleotidyltransferase family protein [Polyangiaceae bacterium]HQK16069.1 nucleotidyltransferase family protein [Polyangiaceae bacterium]
MAATDRPKRLEEIQDLGCPADVLLAFAKRNRVGPIIAHALLDLDDASGAILADARAEHEASASRMQVLMDVLDEVAETLDTEGIPLVALKNAGIARGVYSCPACCPMGDIDVLVPRERFRDAHRLVLDSGFEFASRSVVEPAELEAGLLSGGTEYRKSVSGQDVWLELQWRPIAGRWISADQEPSGEKLLAASVPIEGTHARLLCPTHNMVQVALHTAKHSYVRAPGLRLHTDVDRLAAFHAPDWDDVLLMTETLGVSTACYFSFALAHALLDTPLPQKILDELAPPRWQREAVLFLLRRAGLFEPDAPKFNRAEMAVLHSLLFDDPSRFLESASAIPREELRLANGHRILGGLFQRARDLITRYQA